MPDRVTSAHTDPALRVLTEASHASARWMALAAVMRLVVALLLEIAEQGDCRIRQGGSVIR